MKITVVIPTYNRVALLPRAVESVLSQTYRADEIIVVDDGSTDDTCQMVQSHFPEVKIISQPNKGVSAARNMGIVHASNKWIAFLDSDDVWREDKLQLQVAYHKQNPQILFSHTAEVWMRDDKMVKQKRKHQKPQGFCFYENLDFCKIAPSTVMFHKKIVDDIGLFDEKLIVCEDYDMWLRILKKYPVGFVDEALTTKYAGDHEQLSFSYQAMDQFRLQALQKHLPDREVCKMMENKLTILTKGAQKHHNETVIHFCTQMKDLVSHCC